MKFLKQFGQFLGESNTNGYRLSSKELEDIIEIEYEREDFDTNIDQAEKVYKDYDIVCTRQTYPDDSEIGKLQREYYHFYKNGVSRDDVTYYQMTVTSKVLNYIFNKVREINKPIIDRINKKYNLDCYVSLVTWSPTALQIMGESAYRISVNISFDKYIVPE
jgi:hypothetical protein